MIDSESLVTIIEYVELKIIPQYDVLFVRPLSTDEKYGYFNKQPVKLLGFTFCELEVGNKYDQKA